jgi:hypothetical protein
MNPVNIMRLIIALTFIAGFAAGLLIAAIAFK